MVFEMMPKKGYWVWNTVKNINKFEIRANISVELKNSVCECLINE